MSNDIRIFLASKSPRRRQLMEDAGVVFSVRPPVTEVDESLDEDLLSDPAEACKKIAERKAATVVQEMLAEPMDAGMYIIIGADTMVVKDGDIFGKPRNLSHAKSMLRKLAGSTHEVLTGVSVWLIAAEEDDNVSVGFRTLVDRSYVTFRDLTDDEITDYLRKGESFDKAGAYAIQGAASEFVTNLQGSLDTVIGLPIERLIREFPDLKPE